MVNSCGSRRGRSPGGACPRLPTSATDETIPGLGFGHGRAPGRARLRDGSARAPSWERADWDRLVRCVEEAWCWRDPDCLAAVADSLAHLRRSVDHDWSRPRAQAAQRAPSIRMGVPPDGPPGLSAGRVVGPATGGAAATRRGHAPPILDHAQSSLGTARKSSRIRGGHSLLISEVFVDYNP